MKKKSYIIYYSLLVVVLSSSCRKLIEVSAPRSELVTAEVFADSIDATAAVTGIYTRIMNYSTIISFGNGAITLYTGLSSDEIYSTLNDPAENEFQYNALKSSNSINAGFWLNAYRLIYQINTCLESLGQSKLLTSSLKNQLMGECYGLRAYQYFMLVNLYGDVPYVVSSDYTANAILPRASSDSIYAGIDNDLNLAGSLLTDSFFPNNKIRINKSCITALQARVDLYQKRWDKAENNSKVLIESGSIHLEEDLNSVFLAGSAESIWQLPPVQEGFETAEGYKFVPYSPDIVPYYAITEALITSFEPGDERKERWVGSNNINGTTYYYPLKYKLGYDGNNSPIEYYSILRLSEQYLIRAEARTMKGDMQGALTDLNIIRVRSHLPPVNFNTAAEILSAIQHERQIELFCEGGHRWNDLKRTGTINNILSTEKTGWQETDALYPIPINEILANPFLTQNPGY